MLIDQQQVALLMLTDVLIKFWAVRVSIWHFCIRTKYNRFIYREEDERTGFHHYCIPIDILQLACALLS